MSAAAGAALAWLEALPALPGDWAHPAWTAPLLLGWALVAAGLLAARRRAGRRARRLAGAGVRAPRGGTGDALALAALLAAALALAGPRLGTRVERVPATGVDAVLLFDVSRSMDARDVPPSRLDRARRAASVLLEGLHAGDRAALAAFAGGGALLTPLTTDARALAAMLRAIDTDLMSDRATQPEAGLAAAARAFEEGSARPRVVVLLTDGEHLRARAAAARARDAGARVVAVALGSEAGAPVPGRSGPLRDARERAVVTRRETGGLERLAAATGGRLLVADRWGEVDAEALRSEVRREAGAAGERFVTRRLPASRATLLAGLALTLVLAEGLAGLAPRRASPGGRRRWEGTPGGPRRDTASGGLPGSAPRGGLPGGSIASGRPHATERGRRPRDANARGARAGRAGALLGAAAFLALGAGPAGPADAPEEAAPESAALRERLEAAARTVGALRGVGPGAADPAALARAVRARPGSADPLLHLGVARGERGAWREAERAFLAAALRAEAPDAAALAYYDLGVAALERGALERARDAFLDALALEPGDERARFNLQWTLRALEARRAEPERGRRPRGARAGEAHEPRATRSEARERGAPEREGRAATDTEARRAAEAPGREGREGTETRSAPRGRRALRGEAAPLGREEVERWLRAVEDAPEAALRRPAADARPRAGRERPAW